AAPPHRLVGEAVADGELVLRTAAGEHTGVGAKRAIRGQYGFTRAQRMLVELRGAEIPVHALELLEAEFVGAKSAVVQARLLQLHPPQKPHAERDVSLPRLIAGGTLYSFSLGPAS